MKSATKSAVESAVKTSIPARDVVRIRLVYANRDERSIIFREELEALRREHAERLSDWVIDDLVRVGMIRDRRNVADVRVERLPNSYPIYHVSYPGQLDKARTGLSQFTNLHLAGRTGLF